MSEFLHRDHHQGSADAAHAADVRLQRDLGHHDLVGAIIATGHGQHTTLDHDPRRSLAVTFATINVVGGFLVTHRMLAMFKKKKG